jgi:hypothetical protein
MPGAYSCVSLCNNSGGHKFPADLELKKRWIVTIKRDNWTPVEAVQIHELCTLTASARYNDIV